jgi:GAF domain-containing protein/anti-sigma regulatory factor (Ser/Thr protein kinase)
MGRSAKPSKGQADAERPLARKAPKKEAPRVRDVEKRLAEALEQQTATAEILRVISASPTDVQPVFDTIVRNASRLCATPMALLVRVADDVVHLAARQGITAQWEAAARQSYPQALSRNTIGGLTIIERQVVHVPDLGVDDRFADARRLARTMGYRSVVFVPMLRDGTPIGAIGLTGSDPFTDIQIELLKTFADQAVIAIENVRLFTELQQKNQALTRAHAQVSEALEQQTATSEILRVISSSPTDVQPVFDAITRSAVRLCDGLFSAVIRFDGELQHLVAHHNFTPAAIEAWQQAFPMPPSRINVSGRAILDCAIAHIADIETDPEVSVHIREAARTLRYRSILSVPMLRDGRPVGTINVARGDVAPFAESEMELLRTFADQAVIAIENVRLFTELQQKNAALTEAHAQVSEALEQQTATGEILRVIASSPTDVQPVLDAIARSVVRLCDGLFGAVFRFDGELLHFAAHYNFTPKGLEAFERVYPVRLTPEAPLGPAILERRIVHIPDTLANVSADYTRPLVEALGHRSLLAVPMLREGTPLGTINVARATSGPFTDTQIELLKTFADQAVIAIENVRLFTELQTSNRDLTTALDKQTATSDILRAISRSQTDVQPVFDAIVESAVRLLGAYSGVLIRIAGDQIVLAALTSTDDAGDASLREAFPQSLHSEGMHTQAIRDRAPVSIADAHTDPRVPEASRAAALVRGYRSLVVVPLLRHDEAVGTIAVSRREPGGFTDDEIALLQTFAAQAVIAIENVRLFKELEARTSELTQSVEKLTALGEISRAVSSTLDVETVLGTIVSRASQLAGADGCAIYEYDESTQTFHMRAAHDVDAGLVETLRAMPLRKGEGLMGRATETREPIQIADIAAPGVYQSHLRDVLIGEGYRALLSVPLLREEQIIGSLSLNRKEPGEFPPEVIEVLKTFATQSALAIQNARLFREIEAKSLELEVASRHKSEFLANMSHELRTPLNAIIGFSEVLSEGMFGEVSEKQAEYLRDILESGRHLLSLINDILDLSKIEAGRMELELNVFNLPQALDDALTLVRERATRRGIALHKAVDPQLGAIQADERKVKQVLLNLLSNALKFTPEGGQIEVRAVPTDGAVEVSVKDTGIGIAPDDQEAVFEEFRQVGGADKKAEGTGLGLALCRKFVELHGGRIWVTSQVGAGSTFTFTLPMTGHP